MLFLKRFCATLVALILLIQLTACSTTQPLDSVDSQQSITNNEEISTDDNATSEKESIDDSPVDDNGENTTTSEAPTSDQQTTDNSNSNSSKEETTSSNITTSSNNQNIDNTNQDNNNPTNEEKEQEPTYDYTKPICNHTSAYTDPYKSVSKTEFYANYTTSCCNLDATYRSKHGLLSGSLDIPGQYAKDAANQPKTAGKFIRNTATIYLDNGNTYIVIDADGKEVMRIHKAGGYITLEEVAAYMFAFGGDEQIPANYTSSKKTKPSSSIWGEYLRVNHSYFIGDTDKYPYEPELPNISGCGGDLRYYEMDIGTTGTVTPGYAAKPYIDGNKVNRGAARIVYTRYDLNRNGTIENDEVYVFYTHNHYNDFREYLNYYGGWGEMFGNVTGGGEYSSETRANPSPYVPTSYLNLSKPK